MFQIIIIIVRIEKLRKKQKLCLLFIGREIVSISRNKHYSGRGSKGGSTEEGKKKKGGVFSTVKGLVKPLWDKHKHKLYCAVGKKIGFDGWCKPKNGAPTKPEKPVGKKPPKVVKETYTDESCVACLYILEKVERLVARNPMDGEPSGPNNQIILPGPASYNPAAYNAAQDVNLASPCQDQVSALVCFLKLMKKQHQDVHQECHFAASHYIVQGDVV